MKISTLILVCLTLVPLPMPGQKTTVTDLITRVGFLPGHSLDPRGQITEVVLGIETGDSVFYRLRYRGKTLSGGKWSRGLNRLAIPPADLDLFHPGTRTLSLTVQSRQNVLQSRSLVIRIEDAGEKTGKKQKRDGGTYFLRMYLKDQLILARTDRIAVEQSENSGETKGTARGSEFAPVPRITTPEDEALYYSKYAVSFLDIAALGIREIARGIQKNREKQKSLEPVIRDRMTGKIRRTNGSVPLEKTIRLTLTH